MPSRALAFRDHLLPDAASEPSRASTPPDTAAAAADTPLPPCVSSALIAGMSVPTTAPVALQRDLPPAFCQLAAKVSGLTPDTQEFHDFSAFLVLVLKLCVGGVGHGRLRHVHFYGKYESQRALRSFVRIFRSMFDETWVGGIKRRDAPLAVPPLVVVGNMSAVKPVAGALAVTFGMTECDPMTVTYGTAECTCKQCTQTSCATATADCRADCDCSCLSIPLREFDHKSVDAVLSADEYPALLLKASSRASDGDATLLRSMQEKVLPAMKSLDDAAAAATADDDDGMDFCGAQASCDVLQTSTTYLDCQSKHSRRVCSCSNWCLCLSPDRLAGRAGAGIHGVCDGLAQQGEDRTAVDAGYLEALCNGLGSEAQAGVVQGNGKPRND